MKLLQYSNFALGALLFAYFLTRLFNLTVLPIFTDESIYIYWAKVIESTHEQWFISLTDGKPPLLIWLVSILLTVLPDGWYLVAGRLPAVLAGAVSLVALFKLSELLFEKKSIAVVAGLLYIVFPFTLLYDRMALFDPLLQATLLAATFFALKTAKTLQIKYALLWGFSLGLAFLSKPTALLFLGLLPVGVLLFSFEDLRKNWRRVLGLTILALVISEVINNLQRVSSVYFMAAQKNAQFQQPIEELFKNPFVLTIGNMQGFITWIIGYYTVPFLLIGLVGFAVLLAKNFKAGALLIALWIVPIIALATVGREIFPRYILFTTPYFLIAVACITVQLYVYAKKSSFVALVLFGVVLFPLLKMDYYILTNPIKTNFPQTDYDQLVASHPSGYGVDQVYAYINNEVEKGEKVTLVTQGTFGLYPYAFMLEYWNNPNVVIVPRWPLDTIDEEIVSANDTSRLIILLKEHEFIPQQLPLTLIKKIEKPGGRYPLLLTELDKR